MSYIEHGWHPFQKLNMPNLTKNPTLTNFQKYVAELETKRGLGKELIWKRLFGKKT